ncbi:hypothetical protein [Bacteroides eggerthii]|jgi:hypothetical protein|uniref:hypothetical protein n=2 Tax=Bacteroides eggerthii TaxID=28111 RepID=UPI0014871F8F|nr:hypothetical protein [Bacteroides eggerthii]
MTVFLILLTAVTIRISAAAIPRMMIHCSPITKLNYNILYIMAQYFRIATKAFCNTLKAGSFTGDTTMCPTRSQIESAGLYIKKGYTYATDQLVPQDHIERLDWEYTFSVTPTTATISAAGGSQKFIVTSYKRQYSYSNAGNRIYVEGSQTNVGYTSSNSGSGTWTAANDTISYGANTGSTQPSGTITWTQSESFGSDPKKTAAATHKQNADSISSYDNPTVSLAYNSDIPASGASATMPTYSYSQVVTWISGKITTVTSGGSLTFTKAPNSGTGTIDPSTGFTTAPSKGTTASSRTTVATVTLSVTLNGKTGTSGRADVYQAANSYSDSWENWTVNISADPVRIGARGGTSLLSGTAERKGIREWDSGSKEDMDDSGTPFFSIPAHSNGWSLSENILTAVENTGEERSVVVTASHGEGRNEVAVSQEAGVITWEYAFSIDTDSMSVPATGGTQRVNVSSLKRKLVNGKDSGETETVGFSVGWHSGDNFNSIDRSGIPEYVVFDVGRNTGNERTEYDMFTQEESGNTILFTCSQERGPAGFIVCGSNGYIERIEI